jgi:short-subunit dehydrogenase
MSTKLKPLSAQVVVITGASSGIGLATADAAAERGAKLVLAARSERALRSVVDRLTAKGGDAIAVPCDVSDPGQVNRLAEAAVDRFGRIDTWVNNAGLGLYGRLDEVVDGDSRRLFDVNFWGVVNRSLAALPYLKRNGGALINVGSEVSEGAFPILGMYTASKHAVKGFTDVLRIEVEDVDRAPVSVTLIEPSAVDTPFPQHARNYMDREPKLPGMMLEPRQVAEANLSAAENPTRVKRVGTMTKVNTTLSSMFPGLADRMAAKQVDQLNYAERPRHPEGALFQPSEATGVIGRTSGTGGREPNH